MEAMAKSFIIYISSTTASLSYSYFISSKLPKGTYRFISLLPVIFLFTILPLRCSSVFATALAASFTTWLTNFKLIRFAFDLDQSPYHPSDSLLRFITVASLPIKTRSTTSRSGSGRSSDGLRGLNPVQAMDSDLNSINSPKDRSGLKLGLQILIFTVLVKTVTYNNNEVPFHRFNQFHPNFILIIYCGMLFLLIDIVAAVINALLFLTTGLELEPSSNEPYFATSLQSFWGRWNLMVTNTLRHTVYTPVRSAFSGREWAPLAGVMASFVVSGLMHELFVYQLSRDEPTWEMTSFFVIHGVCVVVEMVVKRGFSGRRLRLPEFVAWTLTMGFVVSTGMWLFFPPLVRSRLDARILEEYASVIDFVKDKFSLQNR